MVRFRRRLRNVNQIHEFVSANQKNFVPLTSSPSSLPLPALAHPTTCRRASSEQNKEKIGSMTWQAHTRSLTRKIRALNLFIAAMFTSRSESTNVNGPGKIKQMRSRAYTHTYDKSTPSQYQRYGVFIRNVSTCQQDREIFLDKNVPDIATGSFCQSCYFGELLIRGERIVCIDDLTTIGAITLLSLRQSFAGTCTRVFRNQPDTSL